MGREELAGRASRTRVSKGRVVARTQVRSAPSGECRHTGARREYMSRGRFVLLHPQPLPPGARHFADFRPLLSAALPVRYYRSLASYSRFLSPSASRPHFALRPSLCSAIAGYFGESSRQPHPLRSSFSPTVCGTGYGIRSFVDPRASTRRCHRPASGSRHHL